MAQSQFIRDREWLVGRRAVLVGIGTTALATSATRLPAQDGRCAATPTETRGPFPADGTNGRPRLNVLTSPGIERRDLRGSFDGMTARAEGVQLELTLQVTRGSACAPYPGAAIYLWQNDAAGAYSLYNLPDANYLRGLQVADGEGRVRFTLIVPGCYGGRYPHCHLEVYASARDAAAGAAPLLVSQLAFPQAACRAIYRSDQRYGVSLSNLDGLPIERDFVFADADPAGRARQTIDLVGNGSGFRGNAAISLA